jgi:hypothetical protein
LISSTLCERSTEKRRPACIARRLEEILAEKLDNVRNFKTHAAKMQNAFSVGITSGIPVDELTRVKLLRTSILGHHVIV